MRTLICAAHFDDEVFGAGGYLSRFGAECTVLVMTVPGTNGRYDRSRHERSFAAHLRISQATGAQYHVVGAAPGPDYAPAESQLEEYLELHSALRFLEWQRDHIRPQRVIVPWRGDMNQDHRVLHEAALIAFRASRLGGIDLLSMEIPSSTDRGSEPIGNDGLFLAIVSTAKLRLVEMYAHERADDRSPQVIEALAKLRGAQSGLGEAEFFRVHSEVIR